MKDMVYYLNLDYFTCIFISNDTYFCMDSTWFAERLSKPVGRLADAAKKIGSGNFDIKVTEENTKDEIAFLSRVFNRMTNRLKNQRNKLLKNNKMVEDQREFLEAIISGVKGGIISIDKDEKIEIINSAAANFKIRKR